MSILFGFVGAVLLVALIAIVSRNLTDRKSSTELKRRIPDGSSSNDSSANGFDGGVGGGD